MDSELNLIQLNPCEAAGGKTLLKPKRKLGALKGVCHSFQEIADDNYKFVMPNLNDPDSSNSGSSISQKRGIKLNIESGSDSSKRSGSTSPQKIKEEIKSMKDIVKNKSGFCSKSPSSKAKYLFASLKKAKSEREQKIVEYLNERGIFQIHLSEALKEFKLII